MNKLISFREEGSEGSWVGFGVAEKEPREGFFFLVTVETITGSGEMKFERQLFALLHQQRQESGPISPSGHRASVCAGSVMGPYRAP